jgi:DinB superfamily
MTGKDAIKYALQSTHGMVGMYLSDLSDADLLVRPVPAANHIAWQIGHLISAEVHLLNAVLPGAKWPPLPAGFDEKHNKEAAGSDAADKFLKKSEYLGLYGQVREATIGALEKLSDADLDRPTTGNMAKFAPTVGTLLLLNANHTMMHLGQFTAVRRKLGKPVLF